MTLEGICVWKLKRTSPSICKAPRNIVWPVVGSQPRSSARQVSSGSPPCNRNLWPVLIPCTMNCEVFYLKELEVEQYQIREVLRCILHTIMFNRAFGQVRPRDIDSELFEITYVQCGDPDVEKRIEEKIDQFLTWAEKHPNKKSQVCLSFYETKNNKIAWFGNKVERLDWEQWCVQLNVVQSSQSHKKPYSESVVEERSKRQAVLENALREVTMEILQKVDQKKDHIPPILNTEVVPFPYEITIPSSSDSSFGMDMFKRMLQTGPPTMLS